MRINTSWTRHHSFVSTSKRSQSSSTRPSSVSKSALGGVNPDFYAMPYDKDTCRRRTTLVQAFYNTSGKCYLKSRCSLAIEILVFFLFPLFNTILHIALGFLMFFSGCESIWQKATLIIKSGLYLYYGCFWYVVYVQRVYLNCILNNSIATIRELAGQTKCEGARRLIDRIYSVFHVVRYFTGLLMAFTLLTVTFLFPLLRHFVIL